MKNTNKLFAMSLIAVCALAACSTGTKVSVEKFQEKINAVEEHQYTEATLKYESKSTSTGDMKENYPDEEQSGTIVYTYNAETSAWETTSEDENASEFASNLYSYKDIDFAAMMEEQGLSEDELTFYINPLKIVENVTQESSEDGSYMSMQVKGEIVLDKYAYPVKLNAKTVISMDMSGEILGESISMSGTVTEDSKITISYK